MYRSLNCVEGIAWVRAFFISGDQRLKELEARGLVKREVRSTRPIAVTYEITQFGKTALGILEQLKYWT